VEIGVIWAACGAALVDARLVDEPADVAVAMRAEGPSFHQNIAETTLPPSTPQPISSRTIRLKPKEHLIVRIERIRNYLLSISL
jgi:hypothetical protein